ncbi:sulfurtransferase TusA family protein [Nostocoides veronense]|uniref:UPF0033 domain-containing protein n=1 Tax=Nostocoides veronense TaxID=330836 RepID=A0ABP4XNQ3_9MICO
MTPGELAVESPDAGAEVVVDARGTRCPMPVILAARAAKELPSGTRLVVLATDPAAAADVPAWARMRGHTVESVDNDADGQVRAVVVTS